MHTMSLEHFFMLRRHSSVSPLLCVLPKFISIMRFPILIVHPSIGRLVVAFACAAVEMTTDSSQRREMTSSRKIVNNQGDTTMS
jgi:hypothetical protein